MEFQDLSAFFHVARAKSFSRAAGELRIAQSALSRRIARLEHHLGVKLLVRHARGAQMSSAGSELYIRAQALMDELQTIERDVLALAEYPVGMVRVGFTPSTGQAIAPLLVAECRRLFPRVCLELREGFGSFIHEWLAADVLDLALLYDPEPLTDLPVIPLIEEPLYIIVPSRGDLPTCCQVKVFRADDLGKLPLILPGRAHPLHIRLSRLAAERGLTLNIVTQVEGMRTTNSLVKAGLGFTVFSIAGVADDIAAGRLRAIPIRPSMSWKMALVSRKVALASSATMAVQRLIEQQVPKLLSGGLWQGKAVVRSSA